MASNASSLVNLGNSSSYSHTSTPSSPTHARTACVSLHDSSPPPPSRHPNVKCTSALAQTAQTMSLCLGVRTEKKQTPCLDIQCAWRLAPRKVMASPSRCNLLHTKRGDVVRRGGPLRAPLGNKTEPRVELGLRHLVEAVMQMSNDRRDTDNMHPRTQIYQTQSFGRLIKHAAEWFRNQRVVHEA